MRSYDVLGSIAVLKFEENEKNKIKKKLAKKLLEEHKNIRTVLEKIDKVSGRLRTIKTKFLAGIKTKETIHKESGCYFKLNIDSCYFSPRLVNERLEVARLIKKGKVLVLFAGVAPFSIIIGKYSKVEKIVSVELGRECSKYAKENIKLNKLKNIEVIQGDVKKVIPKLKEKFDIIVMPRPQLKDTFLKETFKVTKKNTKIYYYDFGKDAEEILEKVKKEAKTSRKKIKIDKIKRAGEIGPYAYRWRVDMTLLN